MDAIVREVSHTKETCCESDKKVSCGSCLTGRVSPDSSECSTAGPTHMTGNISDSNMPGLEDAMSLSQRIMTGGNSNEIRVLPDSKAMQPLSIDGAPFLCVHTGLQTFLDTHLSATWLAADKAEDASAASLKQDIERLMDSYLSIHLPELLRLRPISDLLSETPTTSMSEKMDVLLATIRHSSLLAIRPSSSSSSRHAARAVPRSSTLQTEAGDSRVGPQSHALSTSQCAIVLSCDASDHSAMEALRSLSRPKVQAALPAGAHHVLHVEVQPHRRGRDDEGHAVVVLKDQKEALSALTCFLEEPMHAGLRVKLRAEDAAQQGVRNGPPQPPRVVGAASTTELDDRSESNSPVVQQRAPLPPAPVDDIDELLLECKDAGRNPTAIPFLPTTTPFRRPQQQQRRPRQPMPIACGMSSPSWSKEPTLPSVDSSEALAQQMMTDFGMHHNVADDAAMSWMPSQSTLNPAAAPWTGWQQQQTDTDATQPATPSSDDATAAVSLSPKSKPALRHRLDPYKNSFIICGTPPPQREGSVQQKLPASMAGRGAHFHDPLQRAAAQRRADTQHRQSQQSSEESIGSESGSSGAAATPLAAAPAEVAPVKSFAEVLRASRSGAQKKNAKETAVIVK